MILFEEDWLRYPTAVADLSTKNRSFVNLAILLKKMGVRNHAFMLALINPSLQGINPHDPNLDMETKGLISAEIAINPWYWFREVLRIPAQAGGKSVFLEANRANISLFWAFFNHVMYILIQPRQTGKSVSTDSLMTYLMRVACENTTFNLLTLNDTLRRNNIKRLKDIVDELPPYLQMKSAADPTNGEEIGVTMLGNRYLTHVAQNSEKQALLMGRGLSSAILHCDEGPYIRYIALALRAALAAGGAAIDQAKAAGAPYGTILTTTAGKKDDKDGRYIYNLLSNAAIWTERFYDCANEKELHATVRKNSSGDVLRINGTFDHRQLGKTDEWLKEKLELALQEGEDANRDYFNIWTNGGVSSPFKPEVVDAIARAVKSIQHSEISNNSFVLNWYLPEKEIASRMAKTTCVIGMDTSDAQGDDDISLIVMDVYTLEVLAAGRYNLINLHDFGVFLAKFMSTYKNTILMPEKRSSAMGICDFVCNYLAGEGENPFRRVFNRVINERDEHPDRFDEIKYLTGRRLDSYVSTYKKFFGYPTSGSGEYSRDKLFGNALRTATRLAVDGINDRMLINQIVSLENRNGRIDHPIGEHDDMVVGWLLCIWFIYHGTGLDYYGIDSSRLVSDKSKAVKQLSEEELTNRHVENELQEEINDLVQEIEDETDDYVIQILENRLQALMRRAGNTTDLDITSADDAIRKVRERRRTATFSGRYQDQSHDNRNNYIQAIFGGSNNYYSGGSYHY